MSRTGRSSRPKAADFPLHWAELLLGAATIDIDDILHQYGKACRAIRATDTTAHTAVHLSSSEAELRVAC